MPSLTQQSGRRAEDVASRFLRAQGLRIIGRNFRRRCGELDLIARDAGVLVIAEVRTRTDQRYGGAAASVGAAKQRRIVRTTQLLLMERPELRRLPVRFDVLVVPSPELKEPSVEWIRHAFNA